MSAARWACPACGSEQVEGLAWTDLNTEAVVSWDECSDYWCSDCEDHYKQICQVTSGGFCLMHEQPHLRCREDNRPAEAVSP